MTDGETVRAFPSSVTSYKKELYQTLHLVTFKIYSIFYILWELKRHPILIISCFNIKQTAIRNVKKKTVVGCFFREDVFPQCTAIIVPNTAQQKNLQPSPRQSIIATQASMGSPAKDKPLYPEQHILTICDECGRAKFFLTTMNSEFLLLINNSFTLTLNTFSVQCLRLFSIALANQWQQSLNG